jgi:hypothetical protein
VIGYNAFFFIAYPIVFGSCAVFSHRSAYGQTVGTYSLFSETILVVKLKPDDGSVGYCLNTFYGYS